jgi:hypothetical protein
MKKKWLRAASVAFAGALIAVGTAIPAGAWYDYIKNNYCTAYVTSFTTYSYAQSPTTPELTGSNHRLSDY